ncbi:MAG: 16S rRNA (uracil(1498)-N(3))-methyltransferase [Candidatus Sedimenticola sp. (ex Thyasira tokunagai)]
MRQPRVYTEHHLSVNSEVALEKGPSRHLIQVLRLKRGGEVTLFNGDGHNYPARLIEVDRRTAVAEIIRQEVAEAAPALKIALGIGISKGERMDFAIQKAVELGVGIITPLTTERCVIRLSPERMEKRLTHWRNILISACEQSGRCRLPKLAQTETLEGWLKQHTSESGIFLDHRSKKNLSELPTPSADDVIQLLVGPEGGLTATERERAEEYGFNGVHLGPRILRTETAPLAAIAAMQVLWGDFC